MLPPSGLTRTSRSARIEPEAARLAPAFERHSSQLALVFLLLRARGQSREEDLLTVASPPRRGRAHPVPHLGELPRRSAAGGYAAMSRKSVIRAGRRRAGDASHCRPARRRGSIRRRCLLHR